MVPASSGMSGIGCWSYTLTADKPGTFVVIDVITITI